MTILKTAVQVPIIYHDSSPSSPGHRIGGWRAELVSTTDGVTAYLGLFGTNFEAREAVAAELKLRLEANQALAASMGMRLG